MRRLLLLALAIPLFAQQQISITTNGAATVTVTASPGTTLTFGPGGGPPGYLQADTTTNVYQLTNPLPTLGDPLHGASGTSVVVHDMNSPTTLYRLTNFDNVCAAGTGASGIVATTQASGETHFSFDNSLIWIGSTGGGQCIYLFNPSTFSIQTIGKLPSSQGGSVGVANLIFGSTAGTSKVIYSDNSNSNTSGNPSRGAILSWDFTGFGAGGGIPTPGTFFNFIQGQTGSWGTTSANCLPTGYAVTWTSAIRGSADDTIWALGLSNAGGQNTGTDVVVYKLGSGCIHLNTNGLTVTGDWGASTITGLTNEHFNVHNVAMSQDGQYVFISWETCISGTCTPKFNYNSYIWQPSTGLVTYDCNSTIGGQRCSGHGAIGYKKWTNASGATKFQEEIRAIAGSPNPPTDLKSSSLTCSSSWLAHEGWVNDNTADTNPFYEMTYNTSGLTGTPAAPFACPYSNEIDFISPLGSGVAPTGGTVYRESLTYSSGLENNPQCDQAIGAVSQDGKYIMWSTDFMGKFGSSTGSESCTIGTNCRCDAVLMVAK